jgi:hypothetical protein
MAGSQMQTGMHHGTRRSFLISAAATLTMGLSGWEELGAAGPEADGCQSGLGLEACTALYRKRCLRPSSEIKRFSFSVSPSSAPKATSDQGAALSAAQLTSFDEALKSNVLGPLARLFELTPPVFGYYDDGNSPNAVASADDAGGNTAVLVGQKLLQLMLAQSGGDYAVMAVCAHEFGHLK